MTSLPDRAVLHLSGEDARSWFANLVTCDIVGLEAGDGRWGALLTPQGKILFDFMVTWDGGSLWLDTDRARAADFAKRLNFYRLRAKVAVEDRSESWSVLALPPGDAGPAESISFADPRDPALGRRAFAAGITAVDETAVAAYHARRIGLGIPEGGKDFAFADTFPHEALMDVLRGVDFKKGCFVGQEVVSRMQHRGTARTRIVPVSGESALPAVGTEIRIGEKPAGTMGSSAGSHGLAMLRLDRVEDGTGRGERLAAGDVELTLAKPGWWNAMPAPKASAPAPR